jgi:hypothetical protein
MLVGPIPSKLAAMKLIQAVDSPESGKMSVRSLRQAGVDFIKVNDSLPKNTYLAIVAEAKREGISFVGHVPPSIGATRASDLGQRSIEHLGGPHHAVLIACSKRETELEARAASILKAEIDALFQGVENREPGELRAAFTRAILESYSERRASTLFKRFRKNETCHSRSVGSEGIERRRPEIRRGYQAETASGSRGHVEGWGENHGRHRRTSFRGRP